MTRCVYWAVWLSFVTFLEISGALEQAMPASEMALKGLMMHLVMVGYSGASFTGTTFIEGIINRHRRWGNDLVVPVRRFMEGSRRRRNT